MAHLNRRQFLALGAAGAGLAAVKARASGGSIPWNAKVSRPIRKYDESLGTACAACSSHCALTAYRQQGRVASLLPEKGGCPRALAAIEALYDGERLTRPMKRVGPRGSGKWEFISWEEAAKAISSALKSGMNSVADLGRPDPLAGELLPKLGFSSVVTEESSKNWAALSARRELYGDELAAAEVKGVDTVILWGSSEVDGGHDFARATRELVTARAEGATVVLVSSRAGAVGGFAHKWIPVRPGFEAVAALTLAQKLLAADPGAAGIFKERLGIGKEEALSALSAKLGGAGDSGISAGDMDYLFNRFASGTVGVRADGAGLANARALEASSLILNLMGANPRLRAVVDTPSRVKANAPREKVAASIVDGAQKVGVYLAYRANPVYAAPESEKLAKAMKDEGRVGLIVSFDVNLTETGMVADILLPAATDLECWNVLSGVCPGGGEGYLLQQPVQVWENEPSFLRAKDLTLAALFDGPSPGSAGEAKQLGDLLAMAAKLAGIAAPQAGQAVAAEAAKYGLKSGKTWTKVQAAPQILKADGAKVLSMIAAFKATAGSGKELALVPFEWTELDPAYPNSANCREIHPEDRIYVNAKTAKALGFKKGDRVALKFSGGVLKGTLFPVQTLHPEAVAVARDFGHWASGSAASLKSSAESVPATHVGRKDFLRGKGGPIVRNPDVYWWREHGPGESLSAAVPYLPDHEGAQAWREIKLTLGKG